MRYAKLTARPGNDGVCNRYENGAITLERYSAVDAQWRVARKSSSPLTSCLALSRMTYMTSRQFPKAMLLPACLCISWNLCPRTATALLLFLTLRTARCVLRRSSGLTGYQHNLCQSIAKLGRSHVAWLDTCDKACYGSAHLEVAAGYCLHCHP